MKEYLLGLDIGTSSVKISVFDNKLSEIAAARQGYNVIRSQPNCVQLCVDAIWKALLGGLQEIKNAVPVDCINGIGISCMCPGLIAMDSSNTALYDAILYSDRRSTEECKWMLDRVCEERIFEITGNKVLAGAISATSILWLKNKYPELYKNTAYFAHINTWLLAKLTGNIAIDPSNASYTSLFDIKRRTWSNELCSAFDIDMNKLPPIHASYEICGRVNTPELISLGIHKGIPVVIGGGDTACAAIAAGVLDNGDAMESVGMTDVLTICVDKPFFSPQLLNRCHVADDRWLYQGALSNAGESINWAMRELGKDLLAQGNLADVLSRYAEQSEPGANGVLFLPYLAGERSPIWNPAARGVFYGISTRTTREDLFRAVLEGCCYGINQMFNIAQSLTGDIYNDLPLAGGGSQDRLWTQLRADITGKRFRIFENHNLSSKGAAILAGVGIGCFASIDEGVKSLKTETQAVMLPNTDKDVSALYKARSKLFEQLYGCLEDLFYQS